MPVLHISFATRNTNEANPLPTSLLPEDMTKELLFAIITLCLLSSAIGGDNPPWVDFVYAKSSPTTFQPADIINDMSGGIFGTDGKTPFVFGNEVKLQGMHLNEGYLSTFTDQTTREVQSV